MTSKRRKRRRSWLEFSENSEPFGCSVRPSNPDHRDFLKYAWRLHRVGTARILYQEDGVQRWKIGADHMMEFVSLGYPIRCMPMQEALANVDATRKALACASVP